MTVQTLAPLGRLGWPRVVGRAAVAAAVVVLLAAAHLRHRPATVCPLRALTGVPCPFCGGTTAAVDLGRGRWADAVCASPLAVALVAAWPLVGVLRPPQWWGRPVPRRLVVAAVLLGAQAWQMHRFGLLPA